MFGLILSKPQALFRFKLLNAFLNSSIVNSHCVTFFSCNINSVFHLYSLIFRSYTYKIFIEHFCNFIIIKYLFFQSLIVVLEYYFSWISLFQLFLSLLFAMFFLRCFDVLRVVTKSMSCCYKHILIFQKYFYNFYIYFFQL